MKYDDIDQVIRDLSAARDTLGAVYAAQCRHVAARKAQDDYCRTAAVVDVEHVMVTLVRCLDAIGGAATQLDLLRDARGAWWKEVAK